MHLLREVHAAQIDDNRRRRIRRDDPQIGCIQCPQCIRDRAWKKRDVDEPGPGDARLVDRLGDTGDIDRGGDLRCQFARLHLKPLGEGHRAVRLEIPELGLTRGRDVCLDLLAGEIREDGRDRVLETLIEDSGRIDNAGGFGGLRAHQGSVGGAKSQGVPLVAVFGVVVINSERMRHYCAASRE